VHDMLHVPLLDVRSRVLRKNVPGLSFAQLWMCWDGRRAL